MGHIYGWSTEIVREAGLDGHFVVYREMKNSIILYCSHQTRDRYIWDRYAIEKDSMTGQGILERLKDRSGKLPTARGTEREAPLQSPQPGFFDPA